MKSIEIKRALKAGANNIHSKIKLNSVLKRTDLMFLDKKLRTVSESQYSNAVLVTYESTINNHSMEGVEFVKNSSFFYGMDISNISLFEKDSWEHESVDSYGMEFIEFQNNWVPSEEETEVLEGIYPPSKYDMLLINGKYWTFAPNLPEIKELALIA